MILCMRCTQIDFEGVETVCGLNFGSPHVAQPPYMTELTWLTIESCYHVWEQEWYEVTVKWTIINQ